MGVCFEQLEIPSVTSRHTINLHSNAPKTANFSQSLRLTASSTPFPFIFVIPRQTSAPARHSRGHTKDHYDLLCSPFYIPNKTNSDHWYNIAEMFVPCQTVPLSKSSKSTRIAFGEVLGFLYFKKKPPNWPPGRRCCKQNFRITVSLCPYYFKKGDE